MKGNGITTCKRVLSAALSVAVAATTCLGSLPAYAEEPATEALVTESQPVEYEVTLPYYDGINYTYDTTRVKQDAATDSRDIVLLYESAETVEVSVSEVTGTNEITEIHVWDADAAEKTEVTWAWTENQAVSFSMPETNVKLEVLTTPVVTEVLTEAVTEALTEPVTEAPTELATEAITEAATAAPLETQEETPAEVPAEPVTEGQPEITDAAQPETQTESAAVQTESQTPATEGATEIQTEAVTESSKPETEGDGLPAQGSIETVDAVSVSGASDFNAQTDFSGISYDTASYTISYVSDDVDLTAAGTYSSIYKVTENATGKFWYVLRPVEVTAETEAQTEAETEVQTEPETELQTEATTEAQTETETAAETEEQTDTDSYAEAAENELGIDWDEVEDPELLTSYFNAMGVTEYAYDGYVNEQATSRSAVVATGRCQVSKTTDPYDNSLTYGYRESWGAYNCVYIRFTTGDFAGYEIMATECTSGHDYAGPLVGQTGSYTVTLESETATHRYYSFTFANDYKYDWGGYQNLRGYFSEEKKLGSLTIHKYPYVSDKDEYKLIINALGTVYADLTATFGVYSDEACTQLVTTVQTDSTGVGSADNLPIGTYYVKEITAPTKYMISGTVRTVDLTADGASVNMYDRPYTVKLKILKKDGDKGYWEDDLSGTQFSLYTKKNCSESSRVETITITSADGKAFSTRLALGTTYYLKETKATANYAEDTTVYKIRYELSDLDTSTATENGTVLMSRTFDNWETISVRFRIKKSTTNLMNSIKELLLYDLDDIDYTYYADKNCTKEIATVTTEDESGKCQNIYSNWLTITSKDKTWGYLAEHGSHTIYVKETSSNRSVAISSTVYEVSYTVKESDTTVSTTTSVEDEGRYGIGAMIKKVDSKTKKPLAGVTFKVTYADAQQGSSIKTRTWYMVTDENGELNNATAKLSTDSKYTSDALFKLKDGTVVWPRGYYTFEEVAGLDGYTWTAKEYNKIVRSNKNETTAAIEITATTVTNDQTNGYAYVQKTSSNTTVTDGNGMYSFAGATFTLTDDAGKTVATLVCDANGKSEKAEVPAGTYHVTETVTPKGYKKNTSIPDITVEADKTAEIKVTDEPVMAGMNYLLEKLDSSGSDKSLTGAEFTVEYFDNENCSGTATRTWVLKTVEDPTEKGTYKAYLNSACLVSGSTLYGENVLPLGSLRIRETKAPEGYQLSSEIKYAYIRQDGESASLTWDSSENGNYKNEAVYANTPSYGGLTVVKADSAIGTAEGSATLAGAVYAVISNNDYSVNISTNPEIKYYKGDTVMTITTDANGNATTGEILMVGSYIVKEITPSTGYTLDTTEYIYTVTADTTTTVPTSPAGANGSTETPIRAGFKISKWDTELSFHTTQGDASLAGAVFELYNASANAVAVDVNGNGTYDAGETFASDAKIASFTTDETGTITTASNYLPYGTYTLKEVTAPTGYTLDGTQSQVTITIGANDNGKVLDLTAKDSSIDNEVIRGGFELSKWDQEVNAAGQTQGDAVLSGAEFTLTNQSSHAVLVDTDGDGVRESYEKGAVIMVLTTDENGRIETAKDALPYGTYSVAETRAPGGYTADGTNLTRTFTIREDGEYQSFTDENTAAKNRVTRFDISIIKFRDTLSSEEATDDVEPILGVQFEIRLKSTGELVTTITTNEEGVATTVDAENYPYGRLPFGTYTIHEVESTVPEGLNAVADFDVTGNIDGKNYTGIYKNDRPIEAPVTVVKTDAESTKIIAEEGFSFQILDADKNVVSFMSYYPHKTEITTFTTDASGTVTLPSKLAYGTYYIHETAAPYGYVLSEDLKFTVEKNGSWDEIGEVTFADDAAMGKIVVNKYDRKTEESLAGAVFSVFANEDIVTPDGTIHYTNGQYIESVTIGEDGIGESSALYLGKYYVQETQAPMGYCLDDTRYEFELKYADDQTPVVTVSYDAYNLPTTLELYKTGLDGKALEGVSFDITRIATADGGSIEDDIMLIADETGEPDEGTAGEGAGTVAGRYVTDANGFITDEYFASGIYEIREVSTLDGYVLDTAPRYFKVDKNGFIFESDKTGKALNPDKAKADTLTLTWENDYTKVDFSKVDVTGESEIPGAQMQILDENGEVVYEWTSTDKPYRINVIPARTYTLVEKLAPEGYVKASSVEFTVDETGEVQTVTMTDKQLLVTKTDVTGEKELPGAELTVTDTEGNVVDSWTSTDESHAVSGLEVGKSYTLTEKTAPAGYVIAESVTFTVEDDGKIQTVSMTDKQVYVSKKTVTGTDELPGASLEVKDADGNTVDSWVSGEEAHAVSGLKVGQTYTLTETAAPTGYSIAETITFTVEDDGQIQTVEMRDDLIEVQISKKALTGENELPGAALVIKDKDGNVVDSWISTNESHSVNLAAGEYTLTETQAPDKYATAETITFTVTDSREIQKVTMYDAPLTVEISKQDITTAKELPGATLKVTDKDGNIVETWTSTDEPHKMQLAQGEYTLTEVLAPTGYATAETITFTVTDTAEVQKVVMNDYPLGVTISKQDITGNKELPGAVLTITDKDGKVVETWTSTETPHSVALPLGEYTLTEITAPEKYATAESITFTVKDTKDAQLVTMYDAPLQVSISKKDITTKEELPGAELTITDKDGKVVETWTSTTEEHLVQLAQGEYTLTEVTAPNGYATAESITFTVTDTAEVKHVEMFDTPLKVKISKQDITTKEELPGAELTVTNEKGKVVDKWTSTKEPHYLNLEKGKYTLTEVTAPDGYATAESIEFEITDTEEVKTVTMYDTPLTVEISKKDITNDKELPGARLIVKDEDGNTVEEWISKDEPHKIQLEKGKYTLTEVTAPDGYEVAETITFEVKDTMEVQHVTMYDSPKDSKVDLTGKTDTTTTTPGQAVTSLIAKSVQTGDFFRYAPAVLLIAAGCVLIVVFAVRKKKTGNK